MSSPDLARKPYNHYPYNNSLPVTPVNTYKDDSRKCYSDQTDRRKTAIKINRVSPPILTTKQYQKSNMKKEPLSPDEFVKKNIGTFEEYLKKYKDLFPDITEENHKQNYLEHCKSCYSRYYNKMTTNNDPGTVL